MSHERRLTPRYFFAHSEIRSSGRVGWCVSTDGAAIVFVACDVCICSYLLYADKAEVVVTRVV